MNALETDYSRNFNADSTQENFALRNGKKLNDANLNNVSAVSWSAIIAGSVAASALSLVLVILGFGLGMSTVSVWSGVGISATTLGVTTIIWLAFTHLIAHGMGGYLAGRLRVRWLGTHGDEVFFRDTAHGFLSWALASILFATLFSMVAGSILGATAKTGGDMIGGAAATALASATGKDASDGNNTSSLQSNFVNYLASDLFRDESAYNKPVSDPNSLSNNDAAANGNPDPDTLNPVNTYSANALSANNNSSNIAQVVSIFAHNSKADTLPLKDLQYVSYLIAQQTGSTQAESNLRVSKAFAAMQEKIAEAKVATEKARVVAANTALWFFVFLLLGAFSASFAATLGGRWRDDQADL